MEVAVNGSIGKLTALQESILRSEQLRNYADMMKGKIDALFNIKIKEIYEKMSVMNDRVNEEELNRFLLRIRQSSSGYKEKSYISLKAVRKNPPEASTTDPKAKTNVTLDEVVLTMSVRSVWRLIIGQRDIPDNAWDLELTVTEKGMVDHRGIIRQFKPLIEDTCEFINSCWGSLIDTGIDDVDTYYNICKIKFTNIKLDL